MAYDFPSSPANGANSNGYTFNGTGWVAPNTAFLVNDTPPASPGDNTLWYESDSGGLYARINDGSSTQWVQVNAPAGAYLPLSGGTLTGNLTISKDMPILWLNKTASGQTSNLAGSMANKSRWFVYLGDATAETGSNAGSDFVIHRFNDAGVWIDGPLSINRATGVVTATGLPARPQTAAGAGQLVAQTGTSGGALYAPAGGTWAWWGMYVTAAGAWNMGVYSGVVAGGTVIMGPVGSLYPLAWAWRIA